MMDAVQNGGKYIRAGVTDAVESGGKKQPVQLMELLLNEQQLFSPLIN